MRIGDRIAVKRMPVTYLFEVVGYVSSRQPAKNVPDYCRNITPQSELDKLNIPRETVFVFRDRGTGRPTKKGAARTGQPYGGDIFGRRGRVTKEI